MKICGRCKQPKDEKEFYAAKTGKLVSVCKSCMCASASLWWKNNKERAAVRIRINIDRVRRQKLKYQLKRHRSQKQVVFTHYSGGTPKCACSGCNEKFFEFLCIDHVNGGGNKHRKTISGSIYPWLIKNNFPPGYRVLCHNCNSAYGFFGYCPHNPKSKCLENRVVSGVVAASDS